MKPALERINELKEKLRLYDLRQAEHIEEIRRLKIKIADLQKEVKHYQDLADGEVFDAVAELIDPVFAGLQELVDGNVISDSKAAEIAGLTIQQWREKRVTSSYGSWRMRALIAEKQDDYPNGYEDGYAVGLRDGHAQAERGESLNPIWTTDKWADLAGRTPTSLIRPKLAEAEARIAELLTKIRDVEEGPITIGNRVVYNYAGPLATGVVKGFRPDDKGEFIHPDTGQECSLVIINDDTGMESVILSPVRVHKVDYNQMYFHEACRNNDAR